MQPLNLSTLQTLRFGAILLCLLLTACPMKPQHESAKPGYAQSNWQAMPDWQQAELAPSLAALRSGCQVLSRRDGWQGICAEANQLAGSDNGTLHRFFEQRFTPWQLYNGDGSREGLITGYYEPLLYGSYQRSARYRFPIYAVPDDLLIIDLEQIYPQLKGMRLRGRLQGNHVVPYYDRRAIDGSNALRGNEILWVDDEMALFFLHVQGSGRVQLPDGSRVGVGYANQNGHPYSSIGKQLVAMGELPLESVSMQSIRKWGLDHPNQLKALLDSNASYIFFHKVADGSKPAVGAMNVPLTAGYSMAVDKRVVPLGTPVYLATSWPSNGQPLNRLMMAQDVGGAIKGTIRGDFFWGFGKEAEANAGKMKQSGRMWLLLPNGMQPPVME